MAEYTKDQGPVSGCRRGPYLKWKFSATVTKQVTDQETLTINEEDNESWIRVKRMRRNETAGTNRQQMVLNDDALAVDDVNDGHDITPTSNDKLLDALIRHYEPSIDLDDDDMNEVHSQTVVENIDVLCDEDEICIGIEDPTTVYEDEADDDNSECDNEEIYPNSSLKLGSIVLLICTFIIRFRLSDEALGYLLSLIGLLLPPGHKMLSSLYSLRKYLQQFIHAPQIIYYCSYCCTHVDSKTKICPNIICSQNLEAPGSIAYFVLHSLINQLQVMFKRKQFAESVRHHRFSHLKKQKENVISDIYDSEIYKGLYKTGFLSDPNTLSFSFNTDGVPLFKSSKVSLWPVYLCINELPPHERRLRENILYYGVWISPRKPVMWSFLKPLYKELDLFEKGVKMQDYLGQDFTLRATLFTVICDLPARALVYNSMQFNGKYGCWQCLQPGETYKLASGGISHVYPYQENDPSGPARTYSNVHEDVLQVMQNMQNGAKSVTVHGIKGPFWFMLLKQFDCVNGFICDYMHGICSGVMKLLLSLWFGKKHKGQHFSYFKKQKEADAELRNIKPNTFITRVPRSFEDIVYWKASEYRSFLLYWGIPVMKGILAPNHLLHFCLLVRGIYLLLQDEITYEDIDIAENCLFQFVKCMPLLYSDQYLSMNIHQLVHLAKSVRMTGPLFANNCFLYEDLNGFILEHMHGTQGIDTQVINTINLIQALPIIRDKFLETTSRQHAFYNMMVGDKVYDPQSLLEQGTYKLGKLFRRQMTVDEFIAIRKLHPILSNECFFFQKVFIERIGTTVCAVTYSRFKRRNQSAIKVDNECIFGKVLNFVQVSVHDSVISLMLLQPFSVINYIKKDFIHVVQDTDVILALPVSTIQNICNYVEAFGTKYICEVANQFDKI